MTTRLSLRSALTVAVLALAAAACGDSTSSTPRTLTVSLASATTDGAVLLTLSGPELPAPQPANPSYRVFWRLASSGEMRVMVFGALAEGPLFTMVVPGGRASDYAGSVLQVADRSDALRSSVSGYQIAISAAER